jgi:hypothetical protein
MPIESYCTGCGKLLRVADEFAGRRARCPVCQNIYTVPSAANGDGGGWRSSEESTPSGGAWGDSVGTGPAQSERWFLQGHDGQTYGPVDRRELDGWVAEGRVDGRCRLRNDQQSGWIPADVVYPVLGRGRATSQAKSSSAGGVDFATDSGWSSDSTRSMRMMPHRGPLILILGLCSWFFTCPLFGAIAWYMGSQDLREINEGHRDPQGESLTRAGQILGLVHVVVTAAAFALLFLFFLVAIISSL